MSDTIITVLGEATTLHAAERATARVAVDHQGPKRDAVFAATTSAAEQVTAGLKKLHDATAGPVVEWSSERVAVWAERPRNNGRLLASIYHATIGVRAVFTGFDAMARWVEEVAALDGVNVGGITWELDDATRDALLVEVRTRAVQDAAAKALVFAKAAGLAAVHATAIADPGMLGTPEGASGGSMRFAGAPRMMKSGGESLEFTPAEIEVAARVDARFLASGATG